MRKLAIISEIFQYLALKNMYECDDYIYMYIRIECTNYIRFIS